MAVTFFAILVIMSIATIVAPRKEMYEFKANTTMNLDSSTGAKVFGTLIILATAALYWVFRGSAVIPF